MPIKPVACALAALKQGFEVSPARVEPEPTPSDHVFDLCSSLCAMCLPGGAPPADSCIETVARYEGEREQGPQ